MTAGSSIQAITFALPPQARQDMDAATATSFRGREHLGMCALAGRNGQSGCGEGAKLDGRSYFTRMRVGTVGTAQITPPLPK